MHFQYRLLMVSICVMVPGFVLGGQRSMTRTPAPPRRAEACESGERRTSASISTGSLLRTDVGRMATQYLKEFNAGPDSLRRFLERALLEPDRTSRANQIWLRCRCARRSHL